MDFVNQVVDYADILRTWRWCFYINLPIGGFTLLAVICLLHIDSPNREKLSIFGQLKRLDPIGMLFFVPSMVCLILALQWGGTTYSWSAPRIIGLLVTFAILFIAFVVVEVLTPETAMAPTRVILERSVAGSMAFMFLLSGALMTLIYYLTIWFQVAKNDSAEQAGINTIPLLLSLVLTGIMAGVVTQKAGYYVPAMLFSPFPCAVGAGLLSTLTTTSGHSAWIGYQVLYGLGIGSGMQTCNFAVQNVLPRVDVPIGMAMMFFMQQLGGSIFLGVGQNIFSTKLVDSLSGVAGLDTQVIINTGATALRSIVPPDQLDVVVQAYSNALTRVFILSAALSACMIFGALAVRWMKIKGKDATKARPKSPDMEAGEGKSEGKT